MDNEKPNLLDKLQALKKEYADVVDDVGFDITPSRECPDYTKDPWAQFGGKNEKDLFIRYKYCFGIFKR